jgi:hypothetical protein
MHVYADTFAHQGFCGITAKVNAPKDLTSGDPALDKKIKDLSIKDTLKMIWGNTKAFFSLISFSIQFALREQKSPITYWEDFFSRTPLGHARADVYPDQPYLHWKYTDYSGRVVIRDNPATFMQAVDHMTRAMQAWIANDPTMTVQNYPGLPAQDRQEIERLFRTETEIDGNVRHENWLAAIAAGRFSFGKQELRYIAKGEGSWKQPALGTTREKDNGLERYLYRPDFLKSHWKLFHDSVHAHRNDVVREILPKYGICAA